MKSIIFSHLPTAVVVASLTAGLSSAFAGFANSNPLPEPLCTMKYLVPAGDFTRSASSDAFVRTEKSSIDLQLHTDAGSDDAYRQIFSISWSNFDTGTIGTAETSAPVEGPDNVLNVFRVPTGAGKLSLVLRVSNRGEEQKVTTGECHAEFHAR